MKTSGSRTIIDEPNIIMAENRSGHDNFGQSKYGYENKEAAEYTLFNHATHKHSTFRQFDGRRVDTLVVYA